MHFKTALLLVLSFFIVGCKSESQAFETAFFEALNRSDAKNKSLNNVTVILPKIGCTGCISAAELFISDNLLNNSDRLTVILTDIVNMKVTKIKFGDLLNLPNVIIDRDKAFSSGALSSLYPTIIYWNEKNEIDSISYVSPDNPQSIAQLESRLLEEPFFSKN